MGDRRDAYRDLVGNLKEGDHLDNPGIDGSIMLKWTFEKWGGGMDWISLAQDRDRWQAVVNVIMNLWVAENAGSLIS
jgi:hypothetical protein